MVKKYAHRRYYPNKQIDESKLKKYKKIIGPMVSGKRIFMRVDKRNKIDYIL